MGSCPSVSGKSVVNGPPDHVNANRNAMYPVKSHDYQRRTTALVFPTVQKDLNPPEVNWSSTSSADDEAAGPAPDAGSSFPETDGDMFSTLRPSEKRVGPILLDLTSPEDIPLVHLHQSDRPVSASHSNMSEHSKTVHYMDSTLVPDAHDSRLKRSLREAVVEHEEDRRAVQAASQCASRPNSASRRSNPLSAPPPLTLGIHRDNSDDEYGEL